MICAPVFGRYSSASWPNNAFRRTAESIFEKTASEVFQKSLYVDGPQGYKNVDSGKELVKDVMNMCKADGFYLKNLISNNKKFLLPIS